MSRLWRVARSLQRGASPWGNGEDHAQLLSLAHRRGGLAGGKLMAGAGCSPRANNTSGRRSGGQQQGQLLLQAVTHHSQLPEPPEKFWDVLDRSWCCNPSSISSYPPLWHGVMQQTPAPVPALLSPHCTLHPRHRIVPCFPIPAGPGRPPCCPTAANVPAEGFFLAEKLLSSLWKQ